MVRPVKGFMQVEGGKILPYGLLSCNKIVGTDAPVVVVPLGLWEEMRELLKKSLTSDGVPFVRRDIIQKALADSEVE